MTAKIKIHIDTDDLVDAPAIGRLAQLVHVFDIELQKLFGRLEGGGLSTQQTYRLALREEFNQTPVWVEVELDARPDVGLKAIAQAIAKSFEHACSSAKLPWTPLEVFLSARTSSVSSEATSTTFMTRPSQTSLKLH